MDKKNIRKKIIAKRKSIANSKYQYASKVITHKLLSLNAYTNAQQIGLYMAINNEIDLKKIWQNAQQNAKNCYFPRIKNTDKMQFYKACNPDQFTKNQWGILEPFAIPENYIEPNALDIIIIPMVAFDNYGNRIGMGAGYYDKALQNCVQTILIGVGYEFQKITKINAETWDVKLDIIVTEDEIYYF